MGHEDDALSFEAGEAHMQPFYVSALKSPPLLTRSNCSALMASGCVRGDRGSRRDTPDVRRGRPQSDAGHHLLQNPLEVGTPAAAPGNAITMVLRLD